MQPNILLCIAGALHLVLTAAASPFQLLDRNAPGLSSTTKLVSNTYTTIDCTTRKTSTSVKAAVPTKTVQVVLPPITIEACGKTTPIKTITPYASTSFVSVTSWVTSTLTASTITDVFSTTSTAYLTIDVTLSVTSVVNVIQTSSTTVVATSTVAATPGFIPIDTTSGENTASKKKRGGLDNRSSQSGKQQSSPAKKPANCFSSQAYPVAVTCDEIKQVIYTREVIEIEPTSTITLRPLTSTVSTTIISTSISTVVPANVSTTLSFSTTLSSTITLQTIIATTETSTSIQTVTSTTSVYAACQSANILGPTLTDGLHPYDNYFTDSSANVYSPSANTAYDCCVACLNTANCYYSAYASTYDICNNIVGSSCPVGQPIEGYFYTTVDANDFEAVYSNGPCGSVGDGGDES
ncbi:hypothetical protein G7Y89_g12447 [Cudoniella acicularis]|uniref:Apple domain-containing protein n=1 Tax=Cudoniella acicularis TaxID=354080 RepID=A0A8H4RA26_9HELO|nr:hypothetical protein G7Y89_g12447 [Cudoniella acicularis]